MKLLIILSAVVAACVARPGYLAGGVARLAAPAVAAAPAVVAAPAVAAAPVAAAVAAPVTYTTAIVSEQHHAQDTLGQYRYGYSDGLSTKGEFRTADGITQGAYAYVDGNGEVQNVAYTADAAGFRVAASNLPHAPAVPEAPELQAPEPVQDTAEVAAAKEAHQVAVNIAETRAAAAPAIVAAAAPAIVAASRGAVVAPAAVAASPAVVAAAPARAAFVAAAPAPAVVAAAPARAAFVAAAPAPAVVAAAPAVSVATAVPSRAFAYTSVAAAPLVAAPAPYAGPQHIPAITAAGVPVDTPEVQAARAADFVAHVNAKATLLG